MLQAGYRGRGNKTGRRSAKPIDAKSLSLAHHIHLLSTFGVPQWQGMPVEAPTCISMVPFTYEGTAASTQ